MREVQVTGKQWQLCFRASENSNNASAFHAACDNKGPTVTLVRVGDNVFGGYTEKSWGGNSSESWLYLALTYQKHSDAKKGEIQLDFDLQFEFLGPRVTTVVAQSPAVQLFHAMGEMATLFRSIANITPQEARNYTCEHVSVAKLYHSCQNRDLPQVEPRQWMRMYWKKIVRLECDSTMANLGDVGKFRLIVWRDENPSTVNEISVAVSQTDYTGV